MDREILLDFINESRALIKEMGQILDQLDQTDQPEAQKKAFEDFAIRVDRIMGASKTLLQLSPDHMALKIIAFLTERAKLLGYKAAAKFNDATLPVFQAFFYDITEGISELVDEVARNNEKSEVADKVAARLQSRLEWLVKKVA